VNSWGQLLRPVPGCSVHMQGDSNDKMLSSRGQKGGDEGEQTSDMCGG